MSTKHDCHHHHDDHRRKLYRHITIAIITLIATILFTILLIFLILRPTKPNFTLQDITLYTFNISTTLTSTLQITISSRNPNSRIGIYYDKLNIYATYRNQQITLPTMIPPTYQGHKDVNIWSPYLYGNEVPVAPYLAASLAEDEMAGTVLINVRGAGKVRWKVGSFVSTVYRLNVNCPAYVTFGNKNAGGYEVGPVFKYQLVEKCNVDI